MDKDQNISYAVTQITLGVIFILIITFIIYIFSMRNHVRINIDQYECRPYIIPIISFFDNTRNSSNQYKKCNESFSKKFFKEVSGKFNETNSLLINSAEELLKGVSLVTKSTELSTDLVANKLIESNDQYSIISSILHYSYLKLKAFFDKLVAMIQNIYYALISLMDLTNVIFVIPDIIRKIIAFMIVQFIMIISIIWGMFFTNMSISVGMYLLGTSLSTNPFTAAIGANLITSASVLAVFTATIHQSAAIVCTIFLGIILAVYLPLKDLYVKANKSSYCCFAGKTRIRLKNDIDNDILLVPIKKIQLNTILYHENNNKKNIVIGCLKVVEKDPCENYYTIDDDIIYSSHKIFDEKSSSFIPVHQYDRSKKYRYNNDKYKYNLVTSCNVIYTKSSKYTDFQEYSIENENYYETSLGFLSNTLILINKTNNQCKRICDISIGDQIITSNHSLPVSVIGIYHCIIKKECLGSINNCIIPKHQIIRSDNNIIRANEHKNFCNIVNDIDNIIENQILYHIILQERNVLFYVVNDKNIILECKDFIDCYN